MKKRILTLLTVITILAGIVVPARAEETVPEEAVECLTEMPYEALPEEDFEFDEDSRTITAYIGTSVDVIIPRTIDGVPVENISIMLLNVQEIMCIRIWQPIRRKANGCQCAV